MGSFVDFIESESFFPVLILLLVALMFIFVSVLMSGKKKKKRKQERKKVKIDENAQVQLVSEQGMRNVKKNKEAPLEIETGSTEVTLFLEETDNVESVDISEAEKFDHSNKSTNDNEIEIAPYAVLQEDLNNQYPVSETKEDEVIDVNPIIEIDSSKQEAQQEFDSNTSNSDNLEGNAFMQKPDDDDTINENVKIEESNEYVSEKTEILDFPDFDSLNQEAELEDKIIDAANKYIESIMSR